MATRCLIKFGSVPYGAGYNDTWITGKTLYKHWDGYSENIVPILKEYKDNTENFIQNLLDSDLEFEMVDVDFKETMGADFIYYVDATSIDKKCTVVKRDNKFSLMFGGLQKWEVVEELIL